MLNSRKRMLSVFCLLVRCLKRAGNCPETVLPPLSMTLSPSFHNVFKTVLYDDTHFEKVTASRGLLSRPYAIYTLLHV